MLRTTSTLAATAGLVAIAAAATLRFAVVPAQAQLPADTDTNRQYVGTLDVILDAQALAAGDLANAVVRGVPVTLERSALVTGVTDGIATVSEVATVIGPDGSVLVGSDTTFQVDRKTMQGVGNRSGLVMGWPIGTDQQDYRGWSTDLQAEVDLTYVGAEEHAGIETYVFTSNVQGRIVDEVTLAQFPTTLPKFVLPMVASALEISGPAAEQLQGLLTILPDAVPLAYLIDSQTTYYVEPATGMVIDLDRTEARQVGFDVEGVPLAGLADVYRINYTGEAASVAQTVADAEANASQLSTFGSTLPLALLVIGLALLGGAQLGRKREKSVVNNVLQSPTDGPSGKSLTNA